ncbi:hypothetical protein CEQ90_16370 [Lewinellaceae bacterium SD302]|nr:hypothetical protein CEQ90_16370 [Lewinellaceae bacterium SD302]
MISKVAKFEERTVKTTRRQASAAFTVHELLDTKPRVEDLWSECRFGKMNSRFNEYLGPEVLVPGFLPSKVNPNIELIAQA